MLEDLSLDKKLSSVLTKPKVKSKFLPFLIISLTLIACTEEVEVKPSYTGTSGELLVVTTSSSWNNLLKDSLPQYLQPNFPMLPQAEAMFNLVHYQPGQINDLLSRHRNILRIELGGPKMDGVTFIREEVSKGQVTIVVRATDASQALDIIKQNSPEIINLLRVEERKRYQKWLSLHREKSLEKKLKEKFGYKVILPKGTKLVELDEDFARLKWVREKVKGGKQHFITHGIVLYKHPYYSDTAFTSTALEAIRNKELKRIPGPKKGSQMTTQTFIPAVASPADPKKGFTYAADFRGLWRASNAFLGGPFVSFAQLDQKGEEMIFAEVFILAPYFDKREFLKEAEAIAYSIAP